MRAPRELTRRVLVVSIACGLLGLLTARVVGGVTMRDVFVKNTVPTYLYLWNEYEHARCLADPGGWTLSLNPGSRSFAYDGTTLTSPNPEAPPLDRALLAKADAEEETMLALELRPFFRGGHAVYRASRDRCGVVMVTWTPRVSPLDALQLIVASVVLAGALAAALGIAAVARPLAKLLHHLDDVAHDLRMPIASLQLAIEHAADATTDPPSRELLHGALKDVVYLGALVSNLRLASQLREGWDPHRRAARVDLGDALDRVASRARVLARRSGIALDVARPDGAMFVRCDPVAAEQAIGNVIDNAVAYGDRDGHVAVVLEREGDRFALRVEDDGPGVPPHDLPRLGRTRTFRSDEARARDARGSGLGLTITSEVCARCGWELAFAAVAPRGLRVTIRGRIA